MRKAAGEVKRRKLEMEGEDEHPITEDEHSLDSHCREIERECKKKKTQDSGKIHRLLQLTTLHRRKWLMGMASPTRVAVNINTFPCLKNPLWVCDDCIVVYNSGWFIGYLSHRSTMTFLCCKTSSWPPPKR